MNRSALILCLLQQLHTIHPHGMRAADLATGARLMGHPKETPDTINSLLIDMAEKGLVTKEPDPLDGACSLFRRTEAGRVQLVQHGHAAS